MGLFLDPLLLSVTLGGLVMTSLLLARTALASWILLIGACVLVPHTFLYLRYVPGHFGITEGAPTLNTYYLVIVIASAALAIRGKMNQFKLFLPLIAVLWLLGRFSWGSGAAVSAGAVLYTAAALSGMIGFALGREIRSGSRGITRTFSVFLAALAVVELGLATYQKYGTGLGRADGSFNHPGTLGKFAFLLAVVALPLVTSPSFIVRASSYISLLGFFGCIFVSEGRANYIAFAFLVLLWIVFGVRDSTPLVRALAVTFIAFGGAITVIPFANRFAQDPGGGQRDHFLDVAYEQIPRRLLWGTGPNEYVDVVGKLDALTADGYPVHNVFLLVIGELGLIGLAAFAIPLAVWVHSWWAQRSDSEPVVRHFAMAGLCSLPGFIVIAVTGWGMLQGTAMILWLTSWGVMAGVASRDGSMPDEIKPLSLVCDVERSSND